MIQEPKPQKILFASSVAEERTLFLDLIRIKNLAYKVFFPKTIQEADQMVTENSVDIIITDTDFANGAFADWLSLWPRPFILLAYYGEENRVNDLIRDEACSFILRDSEQRHLGTLPIMIRKVLNIRESLDRQNVHLQISERRYMELVSNIPDIVYTLDGDGRFIYINDAVSQLGYAPSDLIGRHFSTILEEDDVPRVSRQMVLKRLGGQKTGVLGAPKLFDERRTGQRMTRNLVVRLKNKPPEPGKSATASVYSYGEISCVGLTLPEYEGSAIGTVGIIRDITQRQKEELKLKENLHIKEVLLKEIHHRIKNNLQVVSSLLNLQSSTLEDPHARSIFYDSQNQIQSMAMVHEQLYQSDDLQSIDVNGFITSLVTYLFRSYDVDSSRVTSYIQCESINFGVDQAIPLSLIINELISNSIKHGLARTEGSIWIRLELQEQDMIRLEVRDSGSGLPEGFQIESLQSLGMQLVKALCEQLNGSLSWENKSGSLFVVEFPYIPPVRENLF